LTTTRTRRSERQKDRAIALLRHCGMVRMAEFRAEGITAATVSRLERAGALVRRGRGLYQLPDATVDVHHALAEAYKRVPNGVICLVSALAFHDLTDQVPARVWMAIGSKAWRSTRVCNLSRPRAASHHCEGGISIVLNGVSPLFEAPRPAVPLSGSVLGGVPCGAFKSASGGTGIEKLGL